MLAALAVSVLQASDTVSTEAEAERRIEAGIQQEIVLGDLNAAIAQYRIVIKEAASKASVSRALYRYARCLEKLERRSEAHDLYARITKDFSDQPEALLARVRLGRWEYSVSAPANLNFEQGVVGKLPDAWFVPALPNDADRWAQLRRTGCLTNDGCAVVLVPENAPGHVGNLMQSFKAIPYRGKTIRLAAWLRLDQIDAEDHGQMWLGIDRAGNQKGFLDEMSDRPVRSSEWTLREIRAHVDEDATFIKFGVMSIGRGRVWVDRVSFAVVSDDEVTGH